MYLIRTEISNSKQEVFCSIKLITNIDGKFSFCIFWLINFPIPCSASVNPVTQGPIADVRIVLLPMVGWTDGKLDNDDHLCHSSYILSYVIFSSFRLISIIL